MGFGMKRRSASDAIGLTATPPSLAAQVAKYNKLLLSKPSPAAQDPQLEEELIGISASGDQQQYAEDDENISQSLVGEEQESDDVDDSAEIPAAVVAEVEEVLVEMQNIYMHTAVSPDVVASQQVSNSLRANNAGDVPVEDEPDDLPEPDEDEPDELPEPDEDEPDELPEPDEDEQ